MIKQCTGIYVPSHRQLSFRYLAIIAVPSSIRLVIRATIWSSSCGRDAPSCPIVVPSSCLFWDRPYWTVRRQTNSLSMKWQTGQLADSEYFKITEFLHYICTQHSALTLRLTLSTIENVEVV